VTQRLLALPQDRVARVGVDRVDGAGKTTFADELARALEAIGRRTIRASVDGFHNPRSVRYRLGRGSPQGSECPAGSSGAPLGRFVGLSTYASNVLVIGQVHM
jgi:hypothetical protein